MLNIPKLWTSTALHLGAFTFEVSAGTPKDEENIATLETFILTASNAFVLMIQALNLRDLS